MVFRPILRTFDPVKTKARHILWGLLGALVLLCASPLLIYVPPVQQWLVGQAATIASDATGLDISVERVSLSFPLDLSAEGIMAVQEGDTIAIIESMKTEIPVIAGAAGMVSQVFVKESSEVRAGQCLISLKPIPSPGT